MNRRRGASLIEVMVVIAIATIVLSVVGTVFQRLFQADQASTRTALMELTTSRLSNQFRRDIHAARSAKHSMTADGQRPTLELTSAPDQPRIIYKAGQNNVTREMMSGDETTSREVFRMPACRVTFPESEQGESDDSAVKWEKNIRMVTLLIERPNSTLTTSIQASQPLRELAVEAVLGRDHRFSAISIPAPSESREESQ